MAHKAPSKTAERILQSAQDLFNRFGVPNVSTTLIANEVGISTGNLYYHFPAKDELIDTLLARHETRMNQHLGDLQQRPHSLDHLMDFVRARLALVWDFRFLYRDLNDLISRNRRLETHFQDLVTVQIERLTQVLRHLADANTLTLPSALIGPMATQMVLTLNYWLSFEYVRSPRLALLPPQGLPVQQRGACQVLHLLAGCMPPEHYQRLLATLMPDNTPDCLIEPT